MASTENLAVGVLSFHSSKETKAILNAVEALGYRGEWLRAETTSVSVADGKPALDPDVDIVVNRMLLSKARTPLEELSFANTCANVRPMLNPPGAVLTAIHKCATATRLAAAEIPVPDMLFAPDADRLNAGRSAFGREVVFKTAVGTNGSTTWLVDHDGSLTPAVGNRWAFLQEFVSVGGDRHRDLRVYIVGDEVVGGMCRLAPEGDWRTNVALGGEVKDAADHLTTEVHDLAIRATQVLGLDYAGVDLVEGPNGWRVLEVNPTAGFKGFFEATGVSPAPYIAKLAIERVGGRVDLDRVRELAATLDDSFPDCTPAVVFEEEAESADPPVVGYTHLVTVTGTAGSETVVAKADTGATRTSIDTRLAARVGAGPIRSTTRIRSGSHRTSSRRPVVDVTLFVDGRRHDVTASVEDRSHMHHPLLLGRDVLEHYLVDITRTVDDREVGA